MAASSWPWDLWQNAAMETCPEFWGWLAHQLRTYSWFHPATPFWFKGYVATHGAEWTFWEKLFWQVGLGWPSHIFWFLLALSAPWVGWQLVQLWETHQRGKIYSPHSSQTFPQGLIGVVLFVLTGIWNGWVTGYQSQNWAVVLQATPLWVQPPQTEIPPYPIATLPPNTFVYLIPESPLAPTTESLPSRLSPLIPSKNGLSAVFTPFFLKAQETPESQASKSSPSPKLLKVQTFQGLQGWISPHGVKIWQDSQVTHCNRSKNP